MTARHYMIAAALGSGFLLLGAFAFQHIGGMAPCKLCIWQRYPHAIAVALGAVAFFAPLGIVAVLGALAALGTAGVGAYHVGVEQGWWEGPSTCSSAPVGSLSTDDLMEQIMSAPLVRCDEIPWEMFGISMAGWNMLASLAFMGLWMLAYRKL